MPKDKPVDIHEKCEIHFYGEVPKAAMKSPFNVTNLGVWTKYEVKKISFGSNHCLIQFKNVGNELGVLGYNDCGQLGIQTEQNEESLYYTEVKVIKYEFESVSSFTFVDVAAGHNYSLVLIQFTNREKYGGNNHLYKFGNDEGKEINLEVKESSIIYNEEKFQFRRKVFKAITKEELNYSALNSNIIEIFTNEERDLFYTDDGSIYMKGNDFSLGICKKFKLVNKLELGIKSLSLGKNFLLILGKDNNVYVWGDNEYGELGIQGHHSVKTPTKLDFFESKSVVEIATGMRHSLVLTEEGKLFAFGDNSEGQCGGETSAYFLPKKIKFPEKVKIVDISSSYTHSLALSKKGDLYSWGDSSYGKLGYSTGKSTQTTPKIIPFLKCKNISFFTAGPMQSAIVTSTYEQSIISHYKSIDDNN